MLSSLLEKYREIEVSSEKSGNRNDILNILSQILLSDELLDRLKLSDQQLLLFFTNEKIFCETSRFCFGFNSNYQFPIEFTENKGNINETKTLLSFRSLQVLLNMPSSFYIDVLTTNLEFSEICLNFLFHNIKCKIMKIFKELIQNDFNVTKFNAYLKDTHFFGYFTQVILKSMKWNFPIFLSPDNFQHKLNEEKSNGNEKVSSEEDSLYDDLISIEIDSNPNIVQYIDNFNKLIDFLGLGLSLQFKNYPEQTKTVIFISQNNFESFTTYKYMSNIFICNIHDNFAIQGFLVDILKFFPESLPDGSIIKRVSQIACSNSHFYNVKNNDDNDEKVDSTNYLFDFGQYADKIKNMFCDRFDACYLIVDVFRSLPKDSPIFYQYNDSCTLNNMLEAASLIYFEENSSRQFKHVVLMADLIEIPTKVAIDNPRLLGSINLPSNLVICEGNINNVTIASIDLYLKKMSIKKDEQPKSTKVFTRKLCPTYHSFNSNLNDITRFQYQSRNYLNSKNAAKISDNIKYANECELFKFFFESEALQIKLINLFFLKEMNKNNSKSPPLIQSSSANCLRYDQASPTSRFSNAVDYSYPRSASWQNDRSDSNEDQSLLTAIANIPGFISKLENALENDEKFQISLSRNSRSNSNNSNLSLKPNFANDSMSDTSASFVSYTEETSLPPPKWTPGCKFMARALYKLEAANNTAPPLHSKRWKYVITPVIRKFDFLLESNYGYGEVCLMRHRSSSMNDKPQMQPSSYQSNYLPQPMPPYPASEYRVSTSSPGTGFSSFHDPSDKKSASEKVRFSSKVLVYSPDDHLTKDDVDDIDMENDDEDNNQNDGLEIDQFEDYFEQRSSNKNYPHSFNFINNSPFSDFHSKLSNNVAKSPNFNYFPKPGVKMNTSSDSSSDSASNLQSIKMSTQQTLIKNNNKKNQQSQLQISSSNSEGDDEYIIDI